MLVGSHEYGGVAVLLAFAPVYSCCSSYRGRGCPALITTHCFCFVAKTIEYCSTIAEIPTIWKLARESCRHVNVSMSSIVVTGQLTHSSKVVACIQKKGYWCAAVCIQQDAQHPTNWLVRIQLQGRTRIGHQDKGEPNGHSGIVRSNYCILQNMK